MDSVMAAAVAASVGAGSIVGFVLIPGELQRMRRIRALGGSSQPSNGVAPAEARGLLGRWLARLSGFLAERDESLLSGAGLTVIAASAYRYWRSLLPVLAALVTTALQFGQPDWPVWLAATCSSAILLPEAALRWLATRRRALIIHQFPELVDLLCVAAAGGSSLVAALRAAAASSGPLFDEVRLAIRESAAGTPLHAALRQLAKRVGVPAVSAFVGSLCEAESLGAPLVDNLAIQSEAARAAYRQTVEGRLSQLPLQITICALVFLFPTAFIIVALPNIIAFTRGLW